MYIIQLNFLYIFFILKSTVSSPAYLSYSISGAALTDWLECWLPIPEVQGSIPGRDVVGLALVFVVLDLN